MGGPQSEISSKGAKATSRWHLLALTSLVACALFLAGPQPASAASKYAAFIIDANSGKVLHSANADAKRYPASLTKMMTLYVVFEMIEAGRLGLNTELIVTKAAAKRPPSKLGVKAGHKITVRNAIAALVTKSANDVATTIADNLAGSETKFARYMTWKARQLGMKNTVFRNASGLPNWEQKTTARDMATLALALMDNFPQHYHHFKRKYFKYRGRSYRNHNSLLRNYSGTDGIKTGYTRASGFNLAASVRRKKKHLVGIVMGGASSGKRNAQMRRLLTRAFRKASTRKSRKKIYAPAPVLVAAKPRRKPAATSQNARTVKVTRASLRAPSPKPALRKTVSPSGDGGFHVQVGAFDSAAEANARLLRVAARHAGLVGKRTTRTLRFSKGSRTYYRARFAGFTKRDAAATCRALKQKKIDCVVMTATN